MNKTLAFAGSGFLGAIAALTIGAASSMPATGGTRYEVTITNLTRGQIFSPVLVATHDHTAALFVAGQPASNELATLAEEGDNLPLMAALAANNAVSDVQSGSGGIPPGASASVIVSAGPGAPLVSVASMLVNTNDAFVALDSFALPTGRFASTHAIAYDAGSEFNSEDCGFIPGPACGSPGMHDPTTAEGVVYVSNGVHGNADLSENIYDWRNPVAEITVRRVR